MGRLAQGDLVRHWGECCRQVVGRKQGSHVEQVVGHQEEDLANVVGEPKPVGAQWGLEDVEGKVLEEVDPVEGVGDLEGVHNLEVEDLGEEVQVEAGQTDQGREQGEEVCHPDLEGLVEVVGPGQEVEVLEDLEGQGDQEGGAEDPEYHLKRTKT